MATENCYYKKLPNYLKGFSFATFSAKIRTTSVNCTENVKFFKIIYINAAFLTMICHLFFELYITNSAIVIPSIFCKGVAETVKSCISVSLLLANLYLHVVSFLVKWCLFLQLHTSNFPVTRLLTVC